MTRKDAQAKSLDDIRRKGGPKVMVGVTGKGATDTEAAKLLRDVVGLNVQIFSGYRSGNDINLAVDRGEVDARPTTYTSLFSTKPDWLKPDGNMHILVVMGRDTRMPEYPNVPLARELVSDPKDKDLVELAYRCGAISVLCSTSTLAAGVNLPARRVVFRDGFEGYNGSLRIWLTGTK